MNVQAEIEKWQSKLNTLTAEQAKEASGSARSLELLSDVRKVLDHIARLRELNRP